jgi:tetratricopeptide (TPR) repeat protein
MRLILALALCALAAGPQKTERTYYKGVRALNSGDAEKALLKLMDAVLDNPKDERAREMLEEAARALPADRQAGIDPQMEKRFHKEMKAAVKAASRPAAFTQALQGYERALRHFPASRDLGRLLADEKRVFQDALLKAFPQAQNDPAFKGKRPGAFETSDLAAWIVATEGESARFKEGDAQYFEGAAAPGQLGQDLVEAIKRLEKAKLDVLTACAIARTKAKLGKKDAARKSWLEAFNLDTQDREVAFQMDLAGEKAPGLTKEEKRALAGEHHLQGVVDFALGRRADARAHFARAVELWPEHFAAKRALVLAGN